MRSFLCLHPFFRFHPMLLLFSKLLGTQKYTNACIVLICNLLSWAAAVSAAEKRGLGGGGGGGGGEMERAIEKKTRWHLAAKTADLLPTRQEHDTRWGGTCCKTVVIQDGGGMEGRTS